MNLPKTAMGWVNFVGGLVASLLALFATFSGVVRYNELYTDRSVVAVVTNNALPIAVLIVSVLFTLNVVRKR